MTLQINEEVLDKALHRIPELIHELKKIEEQLMELRQELTKSIEDEE